MRPQFFRDDSVPAEQAVRLQPAFYVQKNLVGLRRREIFDACIPCHIIEFTLGHVCAYVRTTKLDVGGLEVSLGMANRGGIEIDSHNARGPCGIEVVGDKASTATQIQ